VYGMGYITNSASLPVLAGKVLSLSLSLSPSLSLSLSLSLSDHGVALEPPLTGLRPFDIRERWLSATR